ncbi:MAG: hypothetical protein GY811_14875 [Myxococcales bacterium]|nr:hypothetical protein [Myxococcales bacterium]
MFRFFMVSKGKKYECEQHGYYECDEGGAVVKMRMLCSGLIQVDQGE